VFILCCSTFLLIGERMLLLTHVHFRYVLSPVCLCVCRCRKIVENFNRVSRVHERYRQTTDGRATAYTEREREFTFANDAWN